jgi:hypothetical protein
MCTDIHIHIHSHIHIYMHPHLLALRHSYFNEDCFVGVDEERGTWRASHTLREQYPLGAPTITACPRGP